MRSRGVAGGIVLVAGSGDGGVREEGTKPRQSEDGGAGMIAAVFVESGSFTAAPARCCLRGRGCAAG